jgi:hypothetical protein
MRRHDRSVEACALSFLCEGRSRARESTRVHRVQHACEVARDGRQPGPPDAPARPHRSGSGSLAIRGRTGDAVDRNKNPSRAGVTLYRGEIAARKRVGTIFSVLNWSIGVHFARGFGWNGTERAGCARSPHTTMLPRQAVWRQAPTRSGQSMLIHEAARDSSMPLRLRRPAMTTHLRENLRGCVPASVSNRGGD